MPGQPLRTFDLLTHTDLFVGELALQGGQLVLQLLVLVFVGVQLAQLLPVVPLSLLFEPLNDPLL